MVTTAFQANSINAHSIGSLNQLLSVDWPNKFLAQVLQTKAQQHNQNQTAQSSSTQRYSRNGSNHSKARQSKDSETV